MHTAAVPEGFRALNLPRNPFIEANGPLYGRLEGEAFVLGFLCETKHCNPMLVCHGGMMATLADMLLLLGTNIQTKLGQFLLTVSLDVDFLAPVRVGDWLEGRTEVLRAGKSIIFSQGRMTVRGEPVARANAVLKPSGRPLADFSPGRYFV
ncbi:MAG TPA: PaaI family thioesterase [Burkholderiales bacterium]|nr:PaaI family thioesterase [Burkholderiales bacterium]